METLELLETTLADYTGTLLLVSHDRRFLDNIATQSLVAEGGGHWKEYVGGYSEWQRQRAAAPTAAPGAAAGAAAGAAPAADGSGAERGKVRGAEKLGFKERRELTALPAEIAALEQEQAALLARMAQPDYHRQGAEQLRADSARLPVLETLLEKKLERWIALDARA
jgi:ATP-binding cassette subfamily F protein uup